MTKTTTISDHAEQFIAMKQKFGLRYVEGKKLLRNFARFTEDRCEAFIRSSTAVEWASQSGSQAYRIRKLSRVHAFACWLHVEDARHEVPPRDALGYRCNRRPQPYLISVPDIRNLLTAALSMGPPDSINPLTWHYLFGLIAVTGLRRCEALALTLNDITPDGLIIRNTKFQKTRMIALRPSTWDALNRYLKVRLKEKTLDEHIFVISTGKPPCDAYATMTFRRLAQQTGIREVGAKRGPGIHSLRHCFAVRSLEQLAPGADPSRHMLALATYLGHAHHDHTYWYLESTPALLHGIAEAAEQGHANGGNND